MRREHQRRGGQGLPRESLERGDRGVDEGLDEPRMVEVDAQLVELGGAGAHPGRGVGEVLAVLPAAGVGGVRGRHKHSARR